MLLRWEGDRERDGQRDEHPGGQSVSVKELGRGGGRRGLSGVCEGVECVLWCVVTLAKANSRQTRSALLIAMPAQHNSVQLTMAWRGQDCPKDPSQQT
jgi:hypothetical protein